MENISEGIGLIQISQERQEQLTKHGKTIKHDVDSNCKGQLIDAVNKLIRPFSNVPPEGWDEHLWIKMCSKPKKERLIIAGALIAAELDRIDYLEAKEDELNNNTYK